MRAHPNSSYRLFKRLILTHLPGKTEIKAAVFAERGESHTGGRARVSLRAGGCSQEVDGEAGGRHGRCDQTRCPLSSRKGTRERKLV